MATYEYRCDSCPLEHAALGIDAKIALEEDPACRCGGELKRVWTAAPVHFNAPGFTATRDDPGGQGYSRKQKRKESKLKPSKKD